MKMNLWRIYKELYEHEVVIRNYYDGKIGMTFTVLSATAGLIIYGIENMYLCVVDERIIILFQLITICLFILQILYTFKAYFSFGFKYRDFPVNLIADDIKDKMVSLNDYEEFETEMSNYISGMLFRTYKKCAETYYETNINKRKAHHILNIITYINFLILLILYVIIIFLK